MANKKTKAVGYAAWNKHLRPDGKKFTHGRTRVEVKKDINNALRDTENGIIYMVQ